MKFSYEWLKKWAKIEHSVEALATQLSLTGFEVDAVIPAAATFSHVLVGEVIQYEKHPEADRLSLCKVNIGNVEPLSIVCGASNVCANIKIAVAIVGANLPNGLTIKKTKLRGELSEGMICSKAELGLADSSEGIWILPADAPIGVDLREYLDLNDQIIEIELTPNRGDCLSIRGLAREIAVLCDATFQGTDIYSNIAHTSVSTVAIQLNAPKNCPHYAGRLISNINTNATTPLWLQEKLRRCGLRSVSPVVDVTNYVLLELGQPLHAFDYAAISGNITIRLAHANEQLELLDGQTVTLTPQHLVIADEAKILALAGIMGGKPSAVTDNTTTIFLESAYFTPHLIAGHARQLGLHTDASIRFERGVDPSLITAALEYATELLLSIVGGDAGPVLTITNEEHLPRAAIINLRIARIKQILGIDIALDQVRNYLSRITQNIVQTNDSLQVTVPTYRHDLVKEIDLIEEVARIHGYENIPLQYPQTHFGNTATFNQGQRTIALLKNALIHRGYFEAITYSFIQQSYQQQLLPQVEFIKLLNPLSSEMDSMRSSLLPGLLQAVQHNLHRQQTRVRLFEIGNCYQLINKAIDETAKIAGVIYGKYLPEQWSNEGNNQCDFYHLKADVESLYKLSGKDVALKFVTANEPLFHPGQSALIQYGDKIVGKIGALHPKLASALINGNTCYLFELDLNELIEPKQIHYHTLSKFPQVRRDIAFIVANDISAEQLRECIANHSGENLTELFIFDVYKGKGIEPEKKSIAFGLVFQHPSKTLVDEDVNSIISVVVSQVEQQFNATLRM